ncbi:hypothetical protein [Mycobacterium sp. 48b]|uniref:hypothetical protein n=1 Tax=Mycobacterium sp. 48b TaxID=3400426 RepID=UPI003AAF5DF9
MPDERSESLGATTEPGVSIPSRHHFKVAAGSSAQHRDLGEPALPGTVTPDVQQNLPRLSVVNYTMWAHNAC